MHNLEYKTEQQQQPEKAYPNYIQWLYCTKHIWTCVQDVILVLYIMS